jgi:hypothetical protein
VQELCDKPAPHWGFYAQLSRALLDSLFLYLPLALLGRQPSTPSYLSFLSTEKYYTTLVFLMPVFLIAQWLFLSAAIHVILRFSRWRSDIDQILNITGMSALVVGAFLVVWDWGYILLGGQDVIFLGISHLVLDLWGVVITVRGLQEILEVPVWFGVLLNVVWLGLGTPLAVVFIRGPL